MINNKTKEKKDKQNKKFSFSAFIIKLHEVVTIHANGDRRFVRRCLLYK
jgi:hypothetical protein